MSSDSNGNNRLILARPDRIGDVVITSSCFAPIKETLPDAEIYFLAHPRMEPLFRKHPALAGFIPLSQHTDAPRRMELLAAQMRKVKAGCIVHLHADEEVEWAAASAEIPRRIGFRAKGDKWLTESFPNFKKTGNKHEGYFNFDLLELLEVHPPAKLVPHITPDADAIERLAQKLPVGIVAGRYAVLHVGAHGEKPRIAPEFFIAVARWLVKERRLYVVLVSGDKDDETAAAILHGAGSSVSWIHNMCGQTDLAEMAFLLRDAAVVFGRDSGPAHIAAALGARTVTFMLEPEPENSARRWTPLGECSWVLEKPMTRGWFESRPAFARRNLSHFSEEEIVESVKFALEA
ncbi:MAG TPA: glycosyltransferase family 9 protein [Opitutales bacterium]|jgi:ADP-heptose:LPS heptosyltransferase|nr:glycosyltransferase family 9 protein [Opitutales bacterium]